MEQKRFLNRNQLKYIVIIAMLIDHIAWAFVPMASVAGQIMHFVGRLTGPTMAYVLAEGYLHTRNVKKYATRLGIFALISWVPYSLFEAGGWPGPFGVIYTLFLGLLAIWIWDKGKIKKWLKVVIIVFLCVISIVGDWPVFDVLWPLFLFIYRDDPKKKWRSFYIISVAACVLSGIGGQPFWVGTFALGILIPPLILQFCYNGESGSRHPFHKWFFYVFYPLHLLVLALIKMYLG